MECNYKSAEWYGEKHPEPDDLLKKFPLILALKKLGRYIIHARNQVKII
jgi:hypothetical protein